MESNRDLAKLAILFLILLVITLLFSYKATALDLTNLYLFENNWNDSRGSVNGNPSGGPTFTSTYKLFGNYSADIDTATQHVEVDDWGDLRGENFTMNIWFNASKNDSATATYLFVYDGTGSQDMDTYLYYIQDDIYIKLSDESSGPSSEHCIDGQLIIPAGIRTDDKQLLTYTQVDDGEYAIWLDGKLRFNSTADCGAGITCVQNTCSGRDFTIGSSISPRFGRGTEGENFIIDAVSIWHGASTGVLNKEEIEYINCSSTGYNTTTCAPTPPPTYFSLTASDVWDSTSITNFSATVNGTDYSTTNGTINTPLLDNVSSLINITFYNVTGYFNRTYSDYNISASGNLNGQLHQAVITFQTLELITGNILSGLTYYVDGSLVSNPVNISAGTFTATAVKAGYYNLSQAFTATALDTKTVNITGMYNALANISVINGADNSSVTSFTITTDYGSSYSTTNGTIHLPLLQNTTTVYNVSGANMTSLLNQNVTLNTSGENITLTAWAFNSIRLNIINESNFQALQQEVTLSTISNLTSFINTTSTGFIILDLLQPNEYEIRFSSDGFNPRSIFLTVSNDSTQNITVYMTENLTTELQVIEVLDTSNSPVEGAVVWLQKEEINQTDSFVTIQEAKTDFNGKTSVFVERDVTVFYRFAVIVDGTAKPIQPSGNYFTGKTSFVPGVTETIQIIIDLEEEPTDYISDSLGIIGNITFTDPDNRTAVFNWIDGRNSITGGRLLVEASYINESLAYVTVYNETLSGSTGSLNYTIPHINNTVFRITAYVTFENSEQIIDQKEKRFDIDVIIPKYEGLLYAVIILVVVAALTAGAGPLPSTLFTVIALVPLNHFKLISIPVTIITSLCALAVILFLRIRKKDE